ncbi:vesicle transport protein SEC20 isoform 2-T2 [Hipposideros larvatus]
MAAAQDVHVRICNQEIVKFDLEVKALIQDIRDCSGPLSALTELNTKVKEKFQQLRHRIQELEQLAKEQDRESEKQALLQEVESHKKQMLSNQTSWRKANLTCKMAIDNVEKAELLQGGDRLRQRKTAKESLAQTSSTITESLMGISRMMSQQVQQSEEAVQSLGRGIRDHQRWCHSSVSTADAAGGETSFNRYRSSCAGKKAPIQRVGELRDPKRPCWRQFDRVAQFGDAPKEKKDSQV